MKKSAQHQAALRYAERGIPVFPCIPWAEDDINLPPGKRGKKPYGPFAPEGFLNATTDPAIIDQWWTAKPNLNIGASPHAAGCCVVDVDTPEALEVLKREYGGLPATFTVKTPRGFHLWYKGSLTTSVGGYRKNGDVKGLAIGVDTRGDGKSYVLMPPSLVNGVHYKVIEKVPPAPVPDVFVATLAAQAATSSAIGIDAPLHEQDTPAIIQRGLETARGKVAGDHPSLIGACNDTGIKHAFELAEIGLSPQGIYKCLQEGWNVRLSDPMTEDAMWSLSYSGYHNLQNKRGVWVSQDPQVAFASFIGQIFEPQQFAKAEKLGMFVPLNETEMEALPPPSWLLPNILPNHQISMLYAPSEGWKTFLALDWALTIATGIDKWGAIEAGATVYIAAEGATSLGKQRRPAWRMFHGIETPIPFHVVTSMPYVTRADQISEMVEAIKEKVGPIKLLVIDTWQRFMTGMDENSTKDAGQAIATVEELRRVLNCAVLVLHHTGKHENRGERGSSVYRASFDNTFELIVDKDSMTAELWARKYKDTEKPAYPWRLKAEKVQSSLVFRFAEAEDLPVKDRLLPSDVGFALRSMKCFGADNAVAGAVVAVEITKHKLDWTQKKAELMLRVLSKRGRLTAYETPDGLYYLPEEAEGEIPF